MGKYMKKSKLTGDVALMDSTIGVRTRAKTLALQRLKNATKTPSYDGAELDSSSFCYLQLRSRRLEKSLPPIPAKKKETLKECRNPNPKGSSEKNKKKVEAALEIEGSFGENNLDFDATDGRGTGQRTPCSFTKDTVSTGSPVSTTRRTSSSATNRSNPNDVQRCITPTMQEIEEFFSTIEEQNQRLFIEKYNFDIVNDMPLSGRYEWVQVTP